MKIQFSFLVLISTLVLGSCQSPKIVRVPAQASAEADTWEEIRELQLEKAELEGLIVHHTNKNNERDVAKYKSLQKVVIQKIAKLEQKLGPIDLGTTFKHKYEAWRVEEEFIELNDLELYNKANNVTFSVSTYEAKYTKVNLFHNFFSKAGYHHTSGPRHTMQRPKMIFQVKCDGPVTFDYLIGDKKLEANEGYKFSLGDNEQEESAAKIILDPSFGVCDFSFVSSRDKKREKTVYGFRLVNETKQMRFMNHILSTTEVCSLKKGSENFIETTEFSNMTCPARYESIEILPEPEDSLRARVVALLGRELPKDFIKNGNPYAPLDFSKAPKFDAILLSYLVYRADFYGTLLARLLTYHADKGTFVRIITSKITSLDKDLVLFEKNMAKHPNIKFVLYQFDKKQKGGANVSELHRTNHAKIFITYSKESSKDSLVIVGGKNIHDGFVMKKPADVSKFPEMVNYVTGDESWAYWRDFEMVIRGPEFVESAIRHYMDFYHINKENLIMKRPSVAYQKTDADEVPTESMRHYMSMPFKDQVNLNLFYARMLDSAKKKILISSPYFRPVKEIADALDRALKRGVDITIITRLDLEGDTADWIIGAVNKDGVNNYFEKIKVYEYTESKVILHSKLLMVDDEMTFISSVNLNKRSFYHDIENGVVVNDPSFTLKMDALYREYLKICTQISEEKKIEYWKRWLIKVFDKVM
jgi:cardiolipin synthase A/B